MNGGTQVSRDRVINEMEKVFAGHCRQIEHTHNVLRYADEIMEGENLSADQRQFISMVVVLHDIGVIEAKRKHGSSAAPYQEKEGALIVTTILERLGCDPIDIQRASYIVGNHHTHSKIDGLDFQILWEADLLENLKSRDVRHDKASLKKVIDDNFKTVTGRKIAYSQYLGELP